MMDETEVKHEFAIYEDQCSVCLSVGRELSPLGSLTNIFMKITSHLEYQIGCLSNVQLCWECQALLGKVLKFQYQVQRARKLIEMGQNYIHGSLSTLTTVIYKDLNLNTVYMQQTNTQTDIVSETDIKEHNDSYENDLNANDLMEDFKDEKFKESDKKKPKTNRWATKRASQNKKPKFKIITDYKFENSFRRIQIDNTEVYSLKEERDSEYYKSNKWKCNRCNLGCKNENLFKKHKERCYGNIQSTYVCDICDTKKSNKRHLLAHIKKHYHKYQCMLCDFSNRDKSQIKSHFSKRHRKLFECVKCQLKFGSRRDFFTHYKKWHEQYTCNHCGITFKMRYCIKDHLRKQHSPYECKQCNKTFSRYNGLWLHNKTRHVPAAAAYCVECDRAYRDAYRYRWHLSNSTRHTLKRTRRIPCPSCEKVFSKNIYMKDHYNLVHLKHFKYRCEKCDKNFIRNADLVKHTRRVHEGILPPKNKICNMCGRGFTTNKILQNHVRTHTGERPFACVRCDARFAQSAALAAHSRAVHEKYAHAQN